MKQLTFLYLAAALAFPSAGQNPFAKIGYDSVMAYNFALTDPRVRSILNKDSTLDKTTVLPGRKMTAKQTSELTNLLSNKATYGGDVMACFDPKHAFVFYRKRKIAGLIEICFACNYLRSTPEFPAFKAYQGRDDGVMNWGFNKTSGKRLRDFCRKLGLKTDEPHFPGEE